VPRENSEWINYTDGKSVRSLAVEGDFVWVGTEGGGLVRINRITGETMFYNKANSGLPDNRVNAIAIDNAGNKWIGTNGGGLAVYREGGVILVRSKEMRRKERGGRSKKRGEKRKERGVRREEKRSEE